MGPNFSKIPGKTNIFSQYFRKMEYTRETLIAFKKEMAEKAAEAKKGGTGGGGAFGGFGGFGTAPAPKEKAVSFVLACLGLGPVSIIACMEHKIQDGMSIQRRFISVCASTQSD